MGWEYEGAYRGNNRRESAVATPKTIERFLNEIIFIPEYHGADSLAIVSVFKDDHLETELIRVPLENIEVKHFPKSTEETKVQFKNFRNPDSLVMRIAEHATILALYPDDVRAWQRFLNNKKAEFADWQKNRARPRRVLPPEK